MTVTLREHQVVAVDDIDRLIAEGNEVILCVQPTGSGKTILKAHYAQREYEKRTGMCIIFAHRDVLLEQISGSLCLMGVPHGFICSAKTQRDITNLNLTKFGDSFYDKTSPVICASSQTFASHVKRGMYPKVFLDSVVSWLMDEAHHLTIGSTWGKCVDALPNATGIGFTATPLRGDGKGLGEHADGYFQGLSVTTNMFNLIQAGKLTLYKIFATGQIDIKGIKKDKDGELNKKQLRIKTQEADITGNAVEQ
jgi:superfamily II DNA or RNA helicase